ncbi:MAG: ADP-glyceromanno-heptose 6-epimerase [Puniceicoccales bacterium]|jgi:ADP-L-glycero-D-manno-heptose 6-epimerase|nr:ADP-glyceromanno-heptose 6-epimerase [Puniceicoccales bacterium]
MSLSDSSTILVTGGAGFIGSALISELNSRGFENILAADFLESDNKFLNLVPLRFSDYVEADSLLSMVEKNDSMLGGVTHIFHLGACSSTIESDNSYLLKNNYEYTKALAHFANRKNIRFVYASSAATYGDGSCGMSDQNSNVDLRPLNMYAYSKHLFDLYAAKNNLHCYGIKYFNIFGPNEYHKGNMRSMVLKAYESISTGGKISLFKSENSAYADGEQKRDFLYVKDAVAMTIFLGEISESIGGKSTHGIYNAGSGIASSWKELVTPVFEALNLPIHIEYVDMPESLRSKYQYYTCANISKIRSAGYSENITPLRDAVTDYVKNYLMQGMKNLSPNTL